MLYSRSSSSRAAHHTHIPLARALSPAAFIRRYVYAAIPIPPPLLYNSISMTVMFPVLISDIPQIPEGCRCCLGKKPTHNYMYSIETIRQHTDYAVLTQLIFAHGTSKTNPAWDCATPAAFTRRYVYAALPIPPFYISISICIVRLQRPVSCRGSLENSYNNIYELAYLIVLAIFLSGNAFYLMLLCFTYSHYLLLLIELIYQRV